MELALSEIRIRCNHCGRGTIPLSTQAKCSQCQTPAEQENQVYICNSPSSGSHEIWQEEIYDSDERKNIYLKEPLPESYGFKSLLLTYREHIRKIKRLKIQPHHNILDIGCSNGRFLNYISKTFGAKGVGIDLSMVALQAAASRNPFQHSFINGSIEQGFPFDDRSIDRVVCFDVLEHIEKTQAMIKDLKRILRPHGQALFHLPIKDFKFSMDWLSKTKNPKLWKKSMKQAGHDYNVIKTVEDYEKLFRSEGFKIVHTSRYNSFLQNIFDYHITHRILNRLFYQWNFPFQMYHQIVAPVIEGSLSFDRLLQKMGIGASAYFILEKP